MQNAKEYFVLRYNETVKGTQMPDDCALHDDTYKISIEEWQELRKKIHIFGIEIDNVQKNLMESTE